MGAMMIYAKIIREKYTYIIITTLVVAVGVGLFSAGPGLFIRQFNVALIIILIGAMSFTITFKDLGNAVRNWKGTSFALLLNYLFAPFLCWVLALLLLSQESELATGLILIGAVPCAGMAMMWTGLLKGDVPLAIVVEAVTMLLAPFVIPPLMSLFAGKFVTIDPGLMFRQLIYTVLFPVLGAIALRDFLEKRGNIQKSLPLMPGISATMAVLLMFMAINTAIPSLMKSIGLIAPMVISTILIFPILFIAAYLVSVKFFLRGTNIAITYSSGMKNLPLAIGIAAMSFRGLETLPIAVAFAFQMLTAVTFYQLFRRAMSQKEKG